MALVATISAALALVGQRAAHADCATDVECKGARICEDGRCVYPTPATELPGAAAAAPATPATASIGVVPAPAAAAAAPPVVAAPPAPAGPDVFAAPVATSVRQPSPPFLVEAGGFAFGIHDGNTGAFGGGVEVGYRLLRWLALGAWFEGSGKRGQVPASDPEVTYRRYDLGLGLTIGKDLGSFLTDLSVLPELTRATIEGRSIIDGPSVTRWGAAAAARLRIGPHLGSWFPFLYVSGSYALHAESVMVNDTHVYYGNVELPRVNTSFGLGLGYLFGTLGPDETTARWPSSRIEE